MCQADLTHARSVSNFMRQQFSRTFDGARSENANQNSSRTSTYNCTRIVRGGTSINKSQSRECGNLSLQYRPTEENSENSMTSGLMKFKIETKKECIVETKSCKIWKKETLSLRKTCTLDNYSMPHIAPRQKETSPDVTVQWMLCAHKVVLDYTWT